MVGAAQPRPEPVRPAANATGSIRLARLFGLDIFVHWSWLLIFALITWSLATEYLPTVLPTWTAPQRWLVGALTSLLFFASVLAHELSHSLVARRRGIPVQSITLFVFGGVSALGGEPRTARDEFLVAVVGPLTSFAAAILCVAVWLAARGAGWRAVQEPAGYLAYINAAVGVFNLVPGFPLDGGRVLRSIVWGIKHDMLEATRIAADAGRVVAALLIGVGVLVTFTGGLLSGIWFIFIGWFLWHAAESSYQQLLLQTDLRGLTVGALAEPDIPRVAPDVTLRAFAHDYVLGRNQRVFLVGADDGDIQGLMTMADLHKAPPAQWDHISVFRVMTPREQLITVAPQTEVLTALQLMADHNVNQLPVVSAGRPAGLLSRAAVVKALRLRREAAASR